MNDIKTLIEFIGALAEIYPKSAGEETYQYDIFFKKYLTGLKGNLPEVDFNKLFKLVLKNNPESAFAPSPNFILSLAGSAKKENNENTVTVYKSGELADICYRKNGVLYEYAYPKADEESYKGTIAQLKKTAEKFWFGTRYDEPA